MRHGNIRNIPHPIQKDVTLVYPNIDFQDETANGTLRTDFVGCGWSKIRILAVNFFFSFLRGNFVSKCDRVLSYMGFLSFFS